MAEAFPEVKKIEYEGPKSTNPLAFKHYNPQEVVEGKTMAEHLRFSVAFWHAFRNPCADPFGAGTRQMPWDDGTDSLENARNRVRAAFEFFEKLGVGFYCFHDRDVAPEGATLAESHRNLDEVPGLDNSTARIRVFDVICENCRKSFTYKADIDFNDWPVKCPYCHHKAGYRAIRCPACDHLFMLPKDPDATTAECPYCHHIIKLRRR